VIGTEKRLFLHLKPLLSFSQRGEALGGVCVVRAQKSKQCFLEGGGEGWRIGGAGGGEGGRGWGGGNHTLNEGEMVAR
jgi:hypothetical protein